MIKNYPNTAVVILILLFLISSPVKGDSKFYYQTGLSGYYPLSDSISALMNGGGIIKFGLIYPVKTNLCLEAVLGIGGFPAKSPTTNDILKFAPLNIGAAYKIMNKPSSSIDLTGGGGYYNFTGFYNDRVSSAGIYFGGRFNLQLTPEMDLQIEARGHELVEKDGLSLNETTEMVELSVGVCFLTNPLKFIKTKSSAPEDFVTPEVSAEPKQPVEPEAVVKEKPTARPSTAGSSRDSDNDGIPDHQDRSPGTPSGVEVDEYGRPLDDDMDGVPDYIDQGKNTPLGVAVDSRGRPLDSDGDGIPNFRDLHPNTPAGVNVDNHGRPVDSDHDGVPDYLDKDNNTPPGTKVDSYGVPAAQVEAGVLRGVGFASGRTSLTKDSFHTLFKLLTGMKYNPNVHIELRAFTDSSGKPEANLRLSQARADAVKSFLTSHGIDEKRLSAKGMGATNFVSKNTKALENRRIEVVITKR